MKQQFMGVDIGGERETWMCVLTPSTHSLDLVERPTKVKSLTEIVRYAEQNFVVAAAIDAQLTWALHDQVGFRTSDIELRKLLPSNCRNWVSSQNSLMAVPVRGRQLAEYLSPIVGTIIETHPRVCLYLANESLLDRVKLYKRKDGQQYIKELWREWIRQFNITDESPSSNIIADALDSLVCATIGYLFHHSPEQLQRLNYSTPDKRGRGPFFVLKPRAELKRKR